MNGWLREQHSEGPHHILAQDFSKALIWLLVLCAEVRVSRFLAQDSRLAVQDARRVGLLQEQERENLDESIRDGSGMENPAPGRVLGYITTG